MKRVLCLHLSSISQSKQNFNTHSHVKYGKSKWQSLQINIVTTFLKLGLFSDNGLFAASYAAAKPRFYSGGVRLVWSEEGPSVGEGRGYPKISHHLCKFSRWPWRQMSVHIPLIVLNLFICIEYCAVITCSAES